MKHIEFAQTGFLQPVLKALEDKGVNLAPVVKRSGLGAFNLLNSESYLPFHTLSRLAREIELDQGIESLATEFRSFIVPGDCGEWCSMIAAKPSLLNACRKAEQLPDVVFTNERISVRINGRVTRYDQHFRNIDASRNTQIIHINAVLLLNTFRCFLGDDWEPLEIHFQSQTALDIEHFFPHAKKTRVYAGMPSTAILLDTDLMLRKVSNVDANKDHYNFDKMPRTCTAYVEALLESTKTGTVPSIKQAAEILDTSERTLRRALAAEQTSYAEIIDNWRCQEALLLINDGSLSLEDIAETLGYSYAPNFFRAFKRWTSFAPREFREQQ